MDIVYNVWYNIYGRAVEMLTKAQFDVKGI